MYDDLGENIRKWETHSFRTLTRHLSGILSQEIGPNAVTRFHSRLVRHISERLFIIPNYDLDHLSILYKATKANTESKRWDIEKMNFLQRSSWYIASFPPN